MRDVKVAPSMRFLPSPIRQPQQTTRVARLDINMLTSPLSSLLLFSSPEALVLFRMVSYHGVTTIVATSIYYILTAISIYHTIPHDKRYPQVFTTRNMVDRPSDNIRHRDVHMFHDSNLLVSTQYWHGSHPLHLSGLIAYL